MDDDNIIARSHQRFMEGLRNAERQMAISGSSIPPRIDMSLDETRAVDRNGTVRRSTGEALTVSGSQILPGRLTYQGWGEFISNNEDENMTTDERNKLLHMKRAYVNDTAEQDLLKEVTLIEKDTELVMFGNFEIYQGRYLDDGKVILMKSFQVRNGSGTMFLDIFDSNVSFDDFKSSLSVCFLKGSNLLGSCREGGGFLMDYSRTPRFLVRQEMAVRSVEGLAKSPSSIRGIPPVFYDPEEFKPSFVKMAYYYNNDITMPIVSMVTVKYTSSHPFNDIKKAYDEVARLVNIRINELDRLNRVDMRRPKVKSKSHRSARKGAYVSHSVPFSAEIECYGRDQKSVAYVSNSMPRDFGMSQDGSLTSSLGIPIEIQTPILQGRRGEIGIAQLCEMLTEKGFQVDKTCGLHVHLDCEPFLTERIRENREKPEALVNMYLAYRLFEPVILSMLPSTRRNNHYCQDFTQPSEHRGEVVVPLPTKQSFVAMEKIKNLHEFELYWYKAGNDYDNVIRAKGSRYTPSRYYGTNFHSLLKDGHLEIRYHSGTLNYEKILYWVDLHGKIVEKCQNGNINRKMLKEILGSDMDLKTLTETLFSILELNDDTVDYFTDRQAKFKDVVASDEILIDKTKKLGVI